MADMIHVKPKGSWKKVKIDPTVFPKADLEGLISLEELTDYEIVKNLTDSANKTSVKKKGTRKQVEKISEERTQPLLKKKKKKKTEETKQKQSREQKDNHNSSGKELTSDRNKRKTPETDPVADLQQDKVKMKKKERKKMLKEKIDKEKEVEGQKIIDVAEEIEKLGSTNDNVSNKKRKNTDMSEQPSPKKKRRKDKVRQKDLGDENSSVKGMEAWKDLFVPPPVLRALKENGFVDPTPIQVQVLPPAVRDKLDILGAAETGSGKTLAFGIPLIHYILERKRHLDEEERQPVSDTGLEEISDELVNNDDDASDDGIDSLVEMGVDDEVEEKEKEDNASDIESDNIISEVDLDNADVEDDRNDGNGSSSEDEQLEELEGDEKGCVKVIKDVDFSWMTPETMVLNKPSRTHPLGLILEPTRELAIQVKNHLLAAAKYTDISVAVIVGGMSVQKQKRILRSCPDIIVATPGRLWELIQEGEVYLSRIEETRHLVIDEADRMVEKGHFEELSKLLLRMNVDEKLRNKRHTYVFSATLTLLHSGPQRVMKKKKKIKLDEKQKLELLMKNIGLKEKAKVIDLTRKMGTVETLTEARINCSKEQKDMYLYYFLKQFPGRTLVFTNSKDCIRRLVSVFTLLQCNPLPLHADMHQRQRLKNLEKFSGNPNSLLLASDVAARGLDIPNVEHVIHYQVPHTVENYVHRSGRTARASKEGLSVVLIGPQDVKDYKKIMHTLNKSEDLPMFPVDQEYMSEVKKRVSMVRQIETQEYRFNKKKHQNDWFRKAADEIGVDIEDENLLHDLGDEGEQAQHKHYISRMKTELDILLRQPILPRTFGSRYPTKMGKLATLPHREVEKDAIKQVKKDKKVQDRMKDRMKARDALRPQLGRPMKLKKNKWKKKKKH